MRVLVYRALGLGDFLTAVPAYRAIRRAFPAYDVSLAAPEPLRPLARLTGAVDTFVCTAELAGPHWDGPPPAVAVNLHGRGPQSHRLLHAMSPGRLVAFARPDLGLAGPEWRAEEHEVSRWCRLLSESGVPSDPADLELDVPTEPPLQRGVTVVHPGAADPARRWPAERFAAVARDLDRAGHRVVVTGVEAERPLARTVAAAAGLPAGRVLAGAMDHAQLAALVAAARLVVCGDTGLAHLATAYRVPSVLLFGPMSPAQWGPPPGRQQHRVLWHAERAVERAPLCGPHPGLSAIGVPEVLTAVADLDRRRVTQQQSR
jgi:ADP-heptose:LPS heptosyltransferase